jgi:hypothetical protein
MYESLDAGQVRRTLSAGDLSLINSIMAVPATQLVLSAPPTASAGTSFNLTVTAEGSSGNTASGFGGMVVLSSNVASDLPRTSITLVNGIGTLPVVLTSAGSETITATYAGLTSGTVSVAVSVGPLAQYLVGAVGANPVQAGSSTLFAVQ